MSRHERQDEVSLFAHRLGAPLWPAGRKKERRLEFLRPRQFAALRDECPVLYVPLGTIEWHGPHLPLGTDALKVHALCLMAAGLAGGVVHPALYWGVDIFWKSSAGQIRRGMDAPAEIQLPGSIYQVQEATFEALLTDIVAEGLRAGCQLIVLCTGHNSPTQWHLVHKVAHAANERLGYTAVYPTNDRERVEKEIDWTVGHGGQWETSLLMALHPDAVDMAELPEHPLPLRGVTGCDPRPGSAAEKGREALELAAARLADLVRALLDEGRAAGKVHQRA